MSVFEANVRVIPDEPGQRRPNQSRIKEAAQRLGKLGFTVLREGRFGVSVAGSEGAFETILGFNPSHEASASHAVSPADPELQVLVDAVEIAPAPRLLSPSV